MKECGQLQAFGPETHAHDRLLQGVDIVRYYLATPSHSDNVQSLRARYFVVPAPLSYVKSDRGDAFELRVKPDGTSCRERDVPFRYCYRMLMEVVPKSSESNRIDNSREIELS
jgi:hypothetical protein